MAKKSEASEIRKLLDGLASDIASAVTIEVAEGEPVSFGDKLSAFKALTAYYKIFHDKKSKSDEDDDEPDADGKVTNFGDFRKRMNGDG